MPLGGIVDNAAFGFGGALLGAILGFVGSLLSTFGKTKDTELEVRTRVVTGERAQWRRDMRELAASYVAIATRLCVGSPHDDDEFEMERLRVQLRLRLNPKEGEELDEALLKLLPLIFNCATSKDRAGLRSKLESFEYHMQCLLKEEWDKSKTEAESGNLATKIRSAN